MFFNCEIFGSCQCHIRNKQTLYGRILRGIHKANDTIQYASIGKYVFKVEVVVIGKTHTAKNNLVYFRAQSHIRHHLVIRLVGVGKERNFLTGYQRVVQVNTGNTRGNEFGRLFTANGVHRRTTDFNLLTFNGRSSINRITISIEETPC